MLVDDFKIMAPMHLPAPEVTPIAAKDNLHLFGADYVSLECTRLALASGRLSERKPNRSPARLLAKGTVMTFDLERARPATLAGLAVALASLMPTEVLAQSSSRTFYDASGRVSGHSTTDSGGSTTIYDASGRVTGRTSTSGNQRRSMTQAGAMLAASRQPSHRADDRCRSQRRDRRGSRC